MYDDPSEPEEVTTPASPQATLSIKIEGWDLNAVEGRIAATLTERMAAKLEKLFEETIEARVVELVDQAAQETIRAAVGEAIAEGWQETNRYGEANGPKVTLKARISKMLDQKQNGAYDRSFSVEKVAQEVIELELRTTFGKEIVAARDRFKAMVDSRVMASWQETVKQALGIR